MPAAATPHLLTPWSVTRSSVAADERFELWQGSTSPTPWPSTYGGDLCVGALGALLRTTAEEKQVHSLQVSFLRPGDKDRGVTYEVERVRDGYRYAHRAVRMSQGGTEIAVATASLRAPRDGEQPASPDGSFALPGGTVLRPPHADIPAPEELPTAAEAIKQRGPLGGPSPERDPYDAYWATGRDLDTRHIDPPLYGETVPQRTWSRLWVRFAPRTAEQRELVATHTGRAALIAYIADDTILEPAGAALGAGWLAPGMFSTTVQQTIWFHADFDAADWLLFSQRLVSATGDHVVCQGELFTPNGTLVATVLQEGIVRVRP
ncbi:MAG: thioesterase family protein [Leucobacter sp.]|nr:thioesterase family protein [Leucobacter sp.]